MTPPKNPAITATLLLIADFKTICKRRRSLCAAKCRRPDRYAYIAGGYRIRPYVNQNLVPEGSIGEGRKSVKKSAALLRFLAFLALDHLFGVLRGEQPLSRGSLPRNSETFFASFFGHKKGRPPGSMTFSQARRRKVAASGGRQ